MRNQVESANPIQETAEVAVQLTFAELRKRALQQHLSNLDKLQESINELLRKYGDRDAK